jgi:hypothetical protein
MFIHRLYSLIAVSFDLFCIHEKQHIAHLNYKMVTKLYNPKLFVISKPK